MAKVTVNRERCKGCSLCVSACPKKIMELDTKSINTKGYSPAICVDEKQCIACGFCFQMCPEVCITVEE